MSPQDFWPAKLTYIIYRNKKGNQIALQKNYFWKLPVNIHDKLDILEEGIVMDISSQHSVNLHDKSKKKERDGEIAHLHSG